MIESIVEVDLGVVDVDIQRLMLDTVALHRSQTSAKLFEVAGCFLAFYEAISQRGLIISVYAQ